MDSPDRRDVSEEVVPHNSTEGSPSSASHLGSKILIRRPPNTNQEYFIWKDRSRSFRVYPCLGGPFHRLDEAEDAINNHVDDLRRPAMVRFQGQGTFSQDQVEHTVGEKDYLVQALLDQYINGDQSLSGDLVHEVERLVSYGEIYENERWFYHFNFTTKTKKANDVDYSNGNMFFAEVSNLQGADYWEVNCCCIIGSNDKGHCYGCINNGSPDLQHPNDTAAYTGGHLDGYLPYGDDGLSDPDDEDKEAEKDRPRIKEDPLFFGESQPSNH